MQDLLHHDEFVQERSSDEESRSPAHNDGMKARQFRPETQSIDARQSGVPARPFTPSDESEVGQDTHVRDAHAAAEKTDTGSEGPDNPDEWPMSSYVALVCVYGSLFAGFLYAAKKAGHKIPEEINPLDLVVFGIATQKASRLITKDWVLAPLRAPFTRYEGPGGPAEMDEAPRGRGFRRAIGELLTCPWCIGQWIATFFAYGSVLSPSLTRCLARILVTSSIADWLNLAYSAAEDA